MDHFSTSLASDKVKEERIFDFFGLPRELRDAIYSMLAIDSEIGSGLKKDGQRGIQVKVQCGLLVDLLVLNHQFKSEHEERLKPGQTLLLVDLGGENLEPQIKKAPFAMTRVEISLIAYCGQQTCSGPTCNASEDMRLHSSWIQSTIARFERLGEVNIKIYSVSGSPRVDSSAQHTARIL